MHSLLVPLSLLIAQAATPQPPRVAVIYSAWGDNAFREEFDGHLAALGWPSESFRNTEGDGLLARLPEFDLVISSGVGNYDTPQDLGARGEEWLAWLEQGGGLLVTDASYDSVLGMWLSRLGEGSEVTSAGCSPFTGANGRSGAITCDAASPLMTAPDRLEPLLVAKGGIWAHIESWGPAWRSLVTCADGRSLLVSRDVGKGSAIATSYFRFAGEVARPAATGLLRNLWSHVQALRSGVELGSLDVGPAAPGPREVRLSLRSTTGQALACHLALRRSYGEEPPTTLAEMDLELPTDAPLPLIVPVDLERRGAVALSCEITAGGATVLSVEQRLTIPRAVELHLADTHLYPEQRGLAFAAGLCPPAGSGVVELVASIDGREVLRQLAPAARSRYVLNASDLALGEHRLSLVLRAGRDQLGEADATFTIHEEPTVGIRHDGTILRNGQPFFPFGWYHVSWGFTAEERLACLRTIGEAGFNTLHAGIRQLDEWQELLDEGQRLGVSVVTEYGIDPAPVIARYREHPAVLAWNPGDEPDGQGISPEEMAARAQRFKDQDPMHPTYMTACVPSSYARYAGVADIFAPDPYPITREGAATRPVYECISSARSEADKHGRSVVAILQCFAYVTDGGWRVPTFEECRNMTYLALLAGAKGIVYYTFADNGFHVLEHPELWAGMKTLPAEIRLLEPALTNGERSILGSGAEGVVAGAWKLPDRTVVILASTEMTEARQVSVNLPPGAGTSIVPLLADGLGSLALSEGQLTGSLAPLEVRVLECRG